MKIPLQDVHEITDGETLTSIELTNGKVILVEDDVVVVVSTEYVELEAE